MELLYIILIVATLTEVFIFILLSLPSPPGVKGTLAEFLSASRKTQLILLGHLSFCLIAGLLFADCYRMEEKYRAERDFLLHNKNVGTGEISFLTQRSELPSFPTRCCSSRETNTLPLGPFSCQFFSISISPSSDICTEREITSKSARLDWVIIEPLGFQSHKLNLRLRRSTDRS